MAVDIKSLKQALLEVRHQPKTGDGVVVASFAITPKLARSLHEAGAKRTMRKSVKGGDFDTLVVRLYTDAH